MRRYLFFCTLAVLAASTVAPVSAYFQGPSVQPKVPGNITFTPVAQVKPLADDSIVAMRGFLIRQVDDDEYLFADESDPEGNDPNNVIKVEIKSAVFQG